MEFEIKMEVAVYLFISCRTPLDFCDAGMTCIDGNDRIVGSCRITVIGLPVQDDPNTAAIMVSLGLCCCDILKMACQDPGGKELLVRDLTALLIEQLFDPFMTYSCHSDPSSNQEALRRVGAKMGSRTAVFRVSRSSSSEDALLMMVLSAER